MNYRSWLTVIILLIIANYSNAQQTTVTSGGDIQSSTGNASYTVGQVIYTTAYSASGTVVQGIQNPVIKVIDGIETASEIQLEMMIYPNPTTNFLTLNIGNYENTALNYQIHDLNGKLIKTKSIFDQETTISLEYLATATYYLIIKDGNTAIKTFSIVKQ